MKEGKLMPSKKLIKESIARTEDNIKSLRENYRSSDSIVILEVNRLEELKSAYFKALSNKSALSRY